MTTTTTINYAYRPAGAGRRRRPGASRTSWFPEYTTQITTPIMIIILITITITIIIMIILIIITIPNNNNTYVSSFNLGIQKKTIACKLYRLSWAPWRESDELVPPQLPCGAAGRPCRFFRFPVCRFTILALRLFYQLVFPAFRFVVLARTPIDSGLASIYEASAYEKHVLCKKPHVCSWMESLVFFLALISSQNLSEMNLMLCRCLLGHELSSRSSTRRSHSPPPRTRQKSIHHHQ